MVIRINEIAVMAKMIKEVEFRHQASSKFVIEDSLDRFEVEENDNLSIPFAIVTIFFFRTWLELKRLKSKLANLLNQKLSPRKRLSIKRNLKDQQVHWNHSHFINSGSYIDLMIVLKCKYVSEPDFKKLISLLHMYK